MSRTTIPRVLATGDLGNRTTVNVREGNDVNYVVDNPTNRYNSVGDPNLSYDSAGNLTADRDGYGYQYDYENRIVEINDVNGTVIAEFAYDGLGRRIRKIDSDANETTHYYYNNNWQVLSEYDGSGTFKAWYAYGNYIDEVLMRGTSIAPTFTKFYVHDHLYSPAALAAWTGTVVERYEYDAYGNPYILEPNFAADPDGKSDYGNPYLFTGRRVDLLDNGSLTLQYNRHRYYDYYAGRWTTHDPLGYVDGMNLYEYAESNPVLLNDAFGSCACVSWLSWLTWGAEQVGSSCGPDPTSHLPSGTARRVCEWKWKDEGEKKIQVHWTICQDELEGKTCTVPLRSRDQIVCTNETMSCSVGPSTSSCKRDIIKKYYVDLIRKHYMCMGVGTMTWQLVTATPSDTQLLRKETQKQVKVKVWGIRYPPPPPSGPLA
ncbi:MAG: RHS repeat domain-containing protein [Planctomycetota bacterium]